MVPDNSRSQISMSMICIDSLYLSLKRYMITVTENQRNILRRSSLDCATQPMQTPKHPEEKKQKNQIHIIGGPHITGKEAFMSKPALCQIQQQSIRSAASWPLAYYLGPSVTDRVVASVHWNRDPVELTGRLLVYPDCRNGPCQSSCFIYMGWT